MLIISRLHWSIPWAILIAGFIAIFRFVRGYLDDKPFTKADQRLVTIVIRLMELQAAAGLIFYVWNGFAGYGFRAYLFFHGLVMFIAVLIPHIADRWPREEISNLHLHYFSAFLASFLLMLFGVSLIPM